MQSDNLNSTLLLGVENKVLRQVLDSLFAFVGVLSLDGILIEANKAALEAANLKEEDVLGKPFWDAYWWNFAADSQDRLKKAIQMAKKGSIVRYDVDVRLSSTKFITIDFAIYPVRDTNDEVLFLVPSAVDITGRKKVERDLTKLAALVESSSEAIWSTTPDGIITSWNKGAEELFGYSASETIGESVQIIIPKDKRKERKNIESMLRMGKGVPRLESIRLTKAGERKEVSISFSPIQNERAEVIAIGIFARDITERKLWEKKLLESEDRFRNLADSMPQLVWTANNEGIVDYYNQKYKDYLGIEKKEDRYEWAPVLHPDDIEYTIGTWKNAVAKRNTYEIEHRIELKGKGYRWHLSRALPVIDIAGNVIKWFGTATDIHETKEAQIELKRREEYFKNLADSIPQLVWIADKDGKNEYVSERFWEYTGLTKEHVAENGWKNAIHPDDLPLALRLWERCQTTGEEFEVEYRLRYRDQSYRWFLVRAIPIVDEQGSILMWFGTSTDVHDQKMMIEKKDEFIGIASHELKTPLTSIKAYVQILERQLNGDHDKKVREVIEKTNLYVDRLSSLITELLDVSKIQAGKLKFHFELTDIDLVIKESIECAQRITHTHKIVLHGKTNEKLMLDAPRIEQVMDNLLSNAMKYSPEAKRVDVYLKKKRNAVIVSVVDYGIGIDEDKQRYIFDRFYRDDENDARFPGLGIGLYISDEIIRRHEGEIWVESTKGKGSTFSFSLPLKS